MSNYESQTLELLLGGSQASSLPDRAFHLANTEPAVAAQIGKRAMESVRVASDFAANLATLLAHVHGTNTEGEMSFGQLLWLQAELAERARFWIEIAASATPVDLKHMATASQPSQGQARPGQPSAH
jgi:hypothetical protein